MFKFYTFKDAENPLLFWDFQGLQIWNIGVKRVNIVPHEH